MDVEHEEDVLSILRGRKGCFEKFSSVSEFKQELEEADLQAEEMISEGRWVLWRESERQFEQQQMIITLLQNLASKYLFITHYLVQYWGVVNVEGRNHYLSTSNYPFLVWRGLRNGHCWYRKRCRNHVYVVDVGDEEQIGVGGVGRAYRKKQPESTPDLRLYSINEFPMRDEAARCGFRGYIALPLYLPHTNHQCCGVLELLSNDTKITRDILSTMDTALRIAGFRSTHTPISISNGLDTKMEPDSEIKDMLELVMATVPRLYLAQVWVPCKQKQCLNIINNPNIHCMEITSFISCKNKTINSYHGLDYYIIEYPMACEFHNLQIDLSCLDSGICDDLSISKNPLAHYAQTSRLSHSFAVSLQHVYDSNHLYVIQFFHQPNFRQDGGLHLLLRTMEMNLKGFQFVSEGGLRASELPQEPNAIDCESTEGLDVIRSYKQKLSQSNFTTYLEMDDSCCLRPFPKDRNKGWVFGINGNSLNFPQLMKEKIENFMKNIKVEWSGEYWIIQFWAPKIVEDRCYLEALDQPLVVGCLAEGLASFRKKCMTHSYFVDDQAKEEELGPPGRVFRNGHPEISPDLYHYTTKEYPIRNYAMQCCISSRGYFALPIFEDEHNHKCIGVLEFVGFHDFDLARIGGPFKAAELFSTHTDMFSEDEQAFRTINYCKEEALTEVLNALELIREIPQVHMANVWVSNGSCVSIKSNMSCMELPWSSTDLWKDFRHDNDVVQWIHVKTGKGMIGMVLASESKSCFCRNLCELSIVDQPLSHFDMRDRRDVCFAICLQSSHTVDLVYVVEFFLNQGPATYEYYRNVLNILLPIMKNKLKSFKIASGKELGDELIVEVIEFSDAYKLDSSESEEADVFPIKFKSVPYCQKEYQYSKEQQAGECSAAASDSKRRNRGKWKKHLHLSLEDLQPHFHKTEKGSAEALGVSLSTLKRACRRLGIAKWPGQGERKHRKNTSPSFYESEFARDAQRPSTSNLQPILDTNTQNTHHVIQIEEDGDEAEKVIIKVKYEEDIIKFEFSLSLGVSNLFEQVATELNLKLGAFKLKYMDEDNDQILLTRGADLQLCPKSRTATGRTCIQFLVHLISK